MWDRPDDTRQPPEEMRASDSRFARPRSLYLHVPFCRHRCGYCNFSVVAGRDDLIQRFLKALDRELAALDTPQIDTVFIGGGTPTHLAARDLQQLLQIVHTRTELSSDAEWSVEANPEDITHPHLSILSDHGVNRMSLGVQSFNNRKLHGLQRGHRGDQAAGVIEMAAEVIPNLSIDLIFAAPDETLEVWREDLRTALSLPIRHLSTYCLTFEKGTQFWNLRQRGQLQPAGEDAEVAMYQTARQIVSAAGRPQYEVSSFATPGYRCRHNLAYWHGNPWLAAGPGAARFVDGRREVNHRSTTTYLKRMERGESPVAESETISARQYASERAAFGIRILEGINVDEFRVQTGFELHSFCESAIQWCCQNGLLQEDRDVVKLTEQGILFADTVSAKFLEAGGNESEQA